MNLKSVLFTLFATAIILSFASCDTEPEEDTANGVRVVTGQITVESAAAWENLEIGLFSDEVYPALEDGDGGLNQMEDYKLTYSDLNDESNVLLTPLLQTSFSVSGTSDTTRTYSFELPDSPPAENDQETFTWWYTAWIDADGDGKLLVKDVSAFLYPEVSQTGEFNRLAWKDIQYEEEDGSFTPRRIRIAGFQRAMDVTEDAVPTYKYSGYDGTSYNDMSTLDSAEIASGFNFHMIPQEGW